MKRKGYVIGILMFVLVLLAGCISIPLGDGNKLKVSKDGIQFTDGDGKQTDISLGEDGIDITDSEGGEHSLSLDEESGTLSFKGEGEDGDTEWTFGEGAELPEGFPDEIPLADDAMIVHAMSVGSQVSIMYGSAMSPGDLDDIYRPFMERDGKDVERSEMSFEEGTLYIYEGYMTFGHVTITISPGDTAEDGSVVTIAVKDPTE